MERKKLLFLSPIWLSLIFSVALAVYYMKPIGEDIWFHLQIAEAWSQGKDGMIQPFVLALNKMPYPPLLHLILAPSFWFGDQISYESSSPDRLVASCCCFFDESLLEIR